MGELGLPTWGIGTLVGLPLTILLFVFVQFMRDEFVSRKRLQDVQKVADSWQHAWEVSQQTNHDVSQLLGQMVVTAQTMEKVLKAMPAQSPGVAEPRSEEDDNS
jgi:hypothetical protein